MNNKNFVSIIIPVIRPKNIKNLIGLIEKNAGIPRNEYEILTKEDKERRGAPIMVKELTEESKYDLVMFLGDDCEPLPNFLSQARETMGSFQGGWGLVGLYDIERPGNHAPTHWLAHKRLLKFTREFFHTGYIHQYCDNELRLWAHSLNRYRLNKLAKVNHKHVGFKDKSKTFRENIEMNNDTDMKRVYSFYVSNHDKDLFNKRKRIVIKETHKCLPLGMRLGLSMLTESLAIMGMDAGKTVIGNKTWNAKGHWENVNMIRINMKILDIFGCSFEHPDLPVGFEDDSRLDSLYDEAYDIKEFVIKHSITMATLPFWRKAYTILPVFINRNVNAIALSLFYKHNIKIKEGKRIWGEYVNKVRREIIKGMDLVEFNYESYISDPIPHIKKVYTSFNLKWMYDKTKENELREFIDFKLRYKS